MNQYESSGMEDLLIRHGYVRAPKDQVVDLHVINTCTVTSKTDGRSRNAIRKARKMSPQATIIVTGCYAQLFPEQVAEVSEADYIIGNDEKTQLHRIIQELDSDPSKKRITIQDIGAVRNFKDFQLTRFSDYTRAFLKIQDGCDCECSYCAVTLARGPSRSQLPEKIIEQIRVLVDQGYKEIVLTGINLGEYGHDLRTGIDLSGILRMIFTETDLQRMRLSSIEPQEWTDELFHVIASEQKICSHFHIPLQSGSDKVLADMRRLYRPADFRNIVSRIKEIRPDAGIGADIIAGFPTEDDHDFSETKNLVSELPLTYLHAFSYSPRPLTRAFPLGDPCPPQVKKERITQLRRISGKKKEDFRKSFLGRTKEVLVISKRDKLSGKLRGMTDNYIDILFDGPDELMNTYQMVKIVTVTDERVTGGLQE